MTPAHFVIIGDTVFDGTLGRTGVEAIQFRSGWKEIGDRGAIQLRRAAGREADFARETQTAPIGIVGTGGKLPRLEKVSVGTPVLIRVGYLQQIPDGESASALPHQFLGYVSHVNPNFPPAGPFGLEVEDYAFQAKRIRATPKVFGKTTLRDVIAHALPDIQLADNEGAASVTFSGYTVNGTDTAFDVLSKLARTLRLAMYFIPPSIPKSIPTGFNLASLPKPTLYVGAPYLDQSRRGLTADLVFSGPNCNVIFTGLQYLPESPGARVEVQQIDGKGKVVGRVVRESADATGNRVVYRVPGATLQEITEIADREYKRANVRGYTGSVTLFGVPKVVHSQQVVVRHPDYSEQNGTYLVDAVSLQYNTGGIRQQVSIGPSIAVL